MQPSNQQHPQQARLTLPALVQSITPSPTAPDQNIFAAGLNPSDFLPPGPHPHPINSSIGSIYSAQIITNPNPYTSLPQVYYSQPPPQRPHEHINTYTEDLLFYLAHGPQFEPTTPNSLRTLSLRELYTRGWTCHDEKTGSRDNSVFASQNLWLLNITTHAELANYSHLDLSGAAACGPSVGVLGTTTGTRGVVVGTGTGVCLAFNPDCWTYLFTTQQFKSKAMTVDELLK